MGQKEKNLINKTLLNLPKNVKLFRINSGMGWTGKIISQNKSKMVIQGPRPFRGAPEGTPDLIGFTEITVTPDMVGEKIAVFTGFEVKATGKLRKCQEKFKNLVIKAGGFFKIIKP